MRIALQVYSLIKVLALVASIIVAIHLCNKKMQTGYRSVKEYSRISRIPVTVFILLTVLLKEPVDMGKLSFSVPIDKISRESIIYYGLILWWLIYDFTYQAKYNSTKGSNFFNIDRSRRSFLLITASIIGVIIVFS